ncbi:helix-turn-helix transcriptional regulator [Chitinophagaceae bacterium MMS25-I14]
MAIRIRDVDGMHLVLSGMFDKEAIQQPLVTERREVYSFPFGDAEIMTMAFSNIYIVYGDMIMRERKRLYMQLDHTDMIEMHFTLAGGGIMTNNATGRTIMIQANQHGMHYTPVFEGVGDYPANTRMKFFEVHFTKDMFLELVKDSCPLLMDFAGHVAAGRVAELHEDMLEISAAMHQAIREIVNCRLTGGLKLLFLQSKCMELLALQAQAFEDAVHPKPRLVCKSDYDKERIHFAREYLLEHIRQPPSLMELAKVAGINEFKLKQGFKEIFDNTVYGYLSDYKLSQARELLLSGPMAVKEVADILGYSSVQHFSSAFRKKFGVPPGKVRG